MSMLYGGVMLGGTAWQDFLKANSGQGKTRYQLSEEYKNLKKEEKVQTQAQARAQAKAQARAQAKVKKEMAKKEAKDAKENVKKTKERLFSSKAKKPYKSYTPEERVKFDEYLTSLGSGKRRIGNKGGKCCPMCGGEWYDDVIEYAGKLAPLVPLFL